jgi:hypothetical protein
MSHKKSARAHLAVVKTQARALAARLDAVTKELEQQRTLHLRAIDALRAGIEAERGTFRRSLSELTRQRDGLLKIVYTLGSAL